MDIIYTPFAVPFLEDNPDVEIFKHHGRLSAGRNTQSGRSHHAIAARILHYVMAAEKNGADAVMVTCTSVNEAAAYARRFSQIPVLNIDEPVARMAVAAGTRIGVLATLPTSPKATIRLLETEAARQGKAITTVPLVAEGAYDILIAGDRAKHDEMVNDALFRLAKQVDVITFAQISMSLVPHGDCGVPLFKIGRSGFDEVKKLMGL
jgi:Asp/Glu/hydantoin racemase